MTDWLRFAFIILVIAADDVLHELLNSFANTRAAVMDRLKSLRQKVRKKVR